MPNQDNLLERDRKKIGRQIMLPVSKAFQIAWKGILIRLFRSLVTMSGVVLAIAFLTSVWTSGALVNALMRIPEGSRDRMLAESVLQKQAIASQSVTLRIGVITPGPDRVKEAGQEAQALRNLFQPYAEFEPVIVPESAEELARTLARYDALVVTGLPEALCGAATLSRLQSWVRGGGALILYGWPSFLPDSAKDAAPLLESLLPAAPTAETVNVDSTLLEQGADLATQGVEWKTMPNRTFLVCDGRPGAVALATFSGKPVLWSLRERAGTVAFMPDADRPDKRMIEWLGKSDLLGKLVRSACADRLRGSGGGSRNAWLITLSLLVCIVGITNAMLMSVTERFREIGTMKCLGALDRFIVKLFLIESTLMGAVGTIIGILIGLGLSVGKAVLSFTAADPTTGGSVYLGLKYFPAGSVCLRVLMALVVGVLLSILAAIYPAYTAARMEPVEAMRVQE